LQPSRCSQVLPLLAMLLVSTLVSAQASQPTLRIDVHQVKGKVSPMLYGLMTEEINYSYDGGLYAELVRNRAFQDNRRGQPFHWVLMNRAIPMQQW
jgi:alpha-N-arabinofuranosidase